MFQNVENFPGAPKARPKKLTKIAISKGGNQQSYSPECDFFPGAPKARPKKLTKIAISKGEINNCIVQNEIDKE